MNSLLQEIEDELKRTRLDKTRLYGILTKIVENSSGGSADGGPQGPQGPPGPPGPTGPPGPKGDVSGDVPVKKATPAPTPVKKAAPKKKAPTTA